jgi:hypothetical protein
MDTKTKRKMRYLEQAIAELQRQSFRDPVRKFSAKQMLEIDPNKLMHNEFCEDMHAIGDASGTPWGGADDRI